MFQTPFRQAKYVVLLNGAWYGFESWIFHIAPVTMLALSMSTAFIHRLSGSALRALSCQAAPLLNAFASADG